MDDIRARDFEMLVAFVKYLEDDGKKICFYSDYDEKWEPRYDPKSDISKFLTWKAGWTS